MPIAAILKGFESNHFTNSKNPATFTTDPQY